MLSTDFMTLSKRMGEGRMPLAESLRYAMLLADSLRRIHDRGKAHGAVTPLNIVMTAGGLELLPAPGWPDDAVTPYTAPEVLQGRDADSRSDIFSFGALLFEMLTGRRAFAGEGRSNLIASITDAQTPSSGNLAVDRLVGPCLAKSPDARTPRMQTVMMQLKLFTVAARRADAAPSTEGVRRNASDSGSLRTEMQQLEGRTAARLQAHEEAVIALQRSSSEAVLALKGQLTAMTAELASARSQVVGHSAGTMDSVAGVLAHVDRGLATVSERVSQLDRQMEEMRQHHGRFERILAADLVDIEQSLKVQAVGIEASGTAMAQTDDLVERVVEALESLQKAVLAQGDLVPERDCFAVN